MWITATDLSAIRGKVDTEKDIAAYDLERDIPYPWHVAAKKVYRVVQANEEKRVGDLNKECAKRGKAIQALLGMLESQGDCDRRAGRND